MKKSLLRYKFLVLLIIMITSVTHAQLVLYEGFDYSLPGYIGGNTGSTGSSSNNWITHSLTAGQTTTIDLYSGSLNYLGSQNPIGNKILLPGSNTTVTRDVNRAITTSSTAIYYSALVNILDNTQLGTSGDYFMAVGQTAGSSVTVLGARLGVKSVNAGANYRLLIMNTSGGSPTYTEFALDLNFGTTYLVVVKYDRSVSYTNATLWVNPTSELSTSVSNNSGSGTFTAFLSICLRNSSGTPKAEIDEIRVGESFASVTPVDVAAPVASFNPSNGTIGVAIDATPKIYFDEPILKTDGSAITDGDLPSLLNFRKTDAGGDAVAYTATIDAAKKIITVTPSGSLLNGQVYYLSVGPVKDGSGFTSSTQSASFTTIAAATPTVTITYPVGSETFYAGDPATLTWTSANITNVKIQVWAPNTARTYDWSLIAENTPASTGSLGITVPPDLYYGTQYKIRISDAGNPAVYSESGNFTCIPVATSLSNLRTRCILDDIVKLSTDVTLTFKRTTGNQKYVQDATAGLLIYDPTAVLTTTLAIGDNFKNLEGKVAFYGGVYEIIPTKTTVTVTSSGNTVTIPEMTLTDYNTNYLNYESELIKLSDVTFPVANGSVMFATASNNDLTDGTTTIIFRTFATGESDIVGAVIPTDHIKMTCIAGFYTTTTTTVQVYSRTLSDFEIIPTAVEKTLFNDDFKMYPVPASSVLNISNVPNLKSIEILDVTGRVVRTINSGTDELLQIPVTGLRRGIYMIRFNTANGKVVKRFVKS